METFRLKARHVENLTERIKAFDFVMEDGTPISCCVPGGHIVVHLPNGTSRRYSLTNGPAETDSFKIAVLREPESRGASRYMHRMVDEGSTIWASGPFNHLPVNPDARCSLLIAGGIGITPIFSIAQYLDSIGRPFEMHYCAKSRDHAAFLEQIEGSRFSNTVRLHLSGFGAGNRLAIDELIRSQPPDTHVYFCGPGLMMEGLKHAVADWDPARVHFEDFSGSSIDTGKAEPFEVEIASTGAIIQVPAERTLMDVLWDHGFPIDRVCEEGICGSCIVDVVSGIPNHRDDFQTDDEKRNNDMIATCCSRAKGGRLVLDL